MLRDVAKLRSRPKHSKRSLIAGDGNTDEMSKDAEEAGTKITELKAKLEAEKAEKSQLDQALMGHKKDRRAVYSGR